MAEAIVSVLLEQLATVLTDEVNLVIGAEVEIEKLRQNFESIHALLDDAEKKQIKEKRIKLWLDWLKEVCYDIDDVLDEWNTSLLKLRIDETNPRSSASCSKGKVCLPLVSCFSSGRQVVHRRDIARRIKQINERLDGIAEERNRFNLASSTVNTHIRREGTTAFADVSLLFGRDEVRNELLSCLLCGGSNEVANNNVKTISLVGMGGLGKTAVAQLIFKNSDVKTHFDVSIWVCVSEAFDLVGVAKSILGGLGPECTQNLISHVLQNLLERISEFVLGKKIFLVLDDVWTEEGKNWETLKQALSTAAPGSRILVTTRKDAVAEAMKSFRVFHLDKLSDEDCWGIIHQEAFAGRCDDQSSEYMDIGQNIAQRCKGLPLTAKTLGCMLRSKRTRREWESVLNSEMWNLEVVQKDVFVPLLLTYYDLPSAIRRCFLYCSVLPKDHEIGRDDLIRRWMAQGYLNSPDNVELEEIGIMYFECLVAQSFFQDIEMGEDGRVTCKMHHIVVDFARYLMKNVPYQYEGRNISWVNERHLLALQKENTCVEFLLSYAEKIRSITVFGDSYVEFSQDLHTFCRQLKNLRSLEFNDGCVVGEFPKEVSKLMHLRLLSLCDISLLKELPEVICELCNLQSLNLQQCYSLERLPSKMDRLINLRCLDTSFCVSLSSYPKGIGRLTSLRDLRGVVLRCDRNDDEEFSLGDLQDLCHLRFLDVMRIVGENIDANEAERANLQSKVHLKRFELCIPSTMGRDDVLQALNPPRHMDVCNSPDEYLILITRQNEVLTDVMTHRMHKRRNQPAH